MPIVEALSYYEFVGYVMAPLLFILWNAWNLARHSKRIVNTWKKKEAHLLKEWSKQTIVRAEAELRIQSRRYLQHAFSFYLVALIAFPLLPAISLYSGLNYYPFTGWAWLFLLTHVRLEMKAKALSKAGIPFQQIATHQRIQDQLRIVSEYNDGIVLPFLFVKSYQRSLDIHADFSKAVRETQLPEEGKMLVELLAKEDEGLMKDMNNAVMGRVHKYQKDAGFSEALSTMFQHAWDTSLPTDTRYRAMLVAQKLEQDKLFPEKGFRPMHEPLLDIQTIELYFLEQQKDCR